MFSKLESYNTILFDCDGVILNSNKIKTNAFYQVAKLYNQKAADELISFHKLNGGVSRYVKFNHFIFNILPKYNLNPNNVSISDLLSSYASYVVQGLLSCEVCSGLQKLKEVTPSSSWSIVSGGDQNEIRFIFNQRKLNHYFNLGVFGSPDTKNQIITRELSNNNFVRPVLYLGDSKYDHLCAKMFDFDFIFISRWTEFTDWRTYTSINKISSFNHVNDIINNTV